VRTPSKVEPIARLDPGEEAAISLAREVRADAVLIDDRAGRVAAAERGLTAIGLLGILDRADERCLLDFERVHAELPVDYRIDPALVKAMLERSRLRKLRRRGSDSGE